jgi:hypothetical protein
VDGVRAGVPWRVAGIPAAVLIVLAALLVIVYFREWVVRAGMARGGGSRARGGAGADVATEELRVSATNQRRAGNTGQGPHRLQCPWREFDSAEGTSFGPRQQGA